MSVILTLTGTDGDTPYADGGFFLAPGVAWAALLRVVRALPADDFPRLHALAATGRSEDTAALAAELGGLIDSDLLPVGVRATAESLLDKVGAGDPGETARVDDEDDLPPDTPA